MISVGSTTWIIGGYVEILDIILTGRQLIRATKRFSLFPEELLYFRYLVRNMSNYKKDVIGPLIKQKEMAKTVGIYTMKKISDVQKNLMMDGKDWKALERASAGSLYTMLMLFLFSVLLAIPIAGMVKLQLLINSIVGGN